MLRRMTLAGAVCMAVAAWCGPAFGLDDDDDVVGAIYTMTNAAGPNHVVVYYRFSDGTLKSAGMVPTGGNGTGGGLGSQGAIVLNDSNRWLFVVNAGSNDITVFEVDRDGLEFAGKFPSGGQMPISATVHGRLVYVLNAGTPNNITGFLLSDEGSLIPIPGSTRVLSAPATGPAQVQFSPDGDLLIVTEKSTNLIDAFPVAPNGLPGTRVSTISHGMTPFGFGFGKRNQLFVSEAFGGAPNASAMSSYVVHDNGSLTLVTGSAPTHQSAACWVVVNNSGRLTYAANTGSASITGFLIGPGGDLTILNANGRTGVTPPGSAPIDEGFSNDGRFLYVLTSTIAGISGFKLEHDGSLSPIGNVPAPATASGLAVR